MSLGQAYENLPSKQALLDDAVPIATFALQVFSEVSHPATRLCDFNYQHKNNQ